MTSSDVLGLQKLKQRTGNVLCSQPVLQCYNTAGQDVSLEYGRYVKDSWSGFSRHRLICYPFAIFLLSLEPLRLSVALLLLSFCYFFAIRLLPVPFGHK